MSELPFRLVARFPDFKAASAAAEKLRARFAAAQAWCEARPEVVVLTDTLAVRHVARGGFTTEVRALFEEEDIDAELKAEDRGELTFGATFRLPMGKQGEEVGKVLHTFLDQAGTVPALKDWNTSLFGGVVLEHGVAGDVAWAHEGSLFELHLPASPAAIDALKKTLMAKKVEQLKLRLCAYDDHSRLEGAKAVAVKRQAASDAEHGGVDPAKTRPGGLSPKDDAPGAWPTVGRRFLFTGKMATLVRDDAKKRVSWLGGIAASSVSRDLDYLVVGDDGSPLYGHGAKGSKILAAEKLQAHGANVKIISERQFLELKRQP